MTNVFDVTKYILHNQGTMSTMKLQKLCYYAQAWSLVWDDEPLFQEDFEAWSNGPVCRPLFAYHKGLFSLSEKEVNDSKLSGDELTESQKETIDIVLEHYGNKNAQWLSTLTHMEEPWRLARNGCPSGANCEEIITKESMGLYYGSL